MRLTRRDLHSLAGAYALDALDPGTETDRFARHLSRCSSCTSEVRGFREVTTALAFAAASPSAQPPPGLRDRVLAAVAVTRQLPPQAGAARRPRRFPSPRRAWTPWLSGAVALAAIAVAVFFGLAQAHTQSELNQLRAQNQAIALVLSAPRVRLLSTGTTRGGTATVALAADRHQLVVITDGLPALPSGQVYQLWLIGTTRIASAGLLPPAQAGRTAPVLASGVASGDTLGLTVEPAPGTAQPTAKPILALPLPV